jgi:hypothetical protein
MEENVGDLDVGRSITLTEISEEEFVNLRTGFVRPEYDIVDLFFCLI